MGHILLAPDKFKGSLDAPGVADALAAGIADADPARPVLRVPVADGGEGTVAAALAAGWSPVTVDATGPTGAPLRVTYARSGGRVLVELATVAGLGVLPAVAADADGAAGSRGPAGRGERSGGTAGEIGPDPVDPGQPVAACGVLAPTTASTHGLGTVVGHALDAGATDIVIGVGGSASTDGGAGLLTGLGARVLDAAGDDLPPGGAALARAHRLDLSGLHPAAHTARFTVACDVDNPLLGEHGAAAVYGPQKGATPDQVSELDAALARWADVLADATGRDARDDPGSGAAGGVTVAAVAALGAVVRSGVRTVLDLVGFDDALAGAALVVTGEGKLDQQTLHGKAPAGVAAAARAAGVPVIAVAGDCDLDAAALHDAGFADVHTVLAHADGDPTTAFAHTATLLRRIGAHIAESPAPTPERELLSSSPSAREQLSPDPGPGGVVAGGRAEAEREEPSSHASAREQLSFGAGTRTAPPAGARTAQQTSTSRPCAR